MRIVGSPEHEDAPNIDTWLAELDAALDGTAVGAQADAWRELRDDVRALAPPPADGFEQRLRERIAARPARTRRVPQAARRLGAHVRLPGRPALLATSGALVAAIVVGLVAFVPSNHGGGEAVPRAVKSPPVSAVAVAGSSAGAGPVGVPAPSGHVQQLSASLTLASTPSQLTSVAAQVARLTVRVGGYVRSSHVSTQQGGEGQANMTLSVPSAKLGTVLGSLGALAQVREQSQSAEDITGTLDAARRRLADARAERQALLRALAKASTEGQIDSLREQIAEARNAISADGSALAGVSRRASTAEVEVTVVGDAHTATTGGLTLSRGLHDAGRVLTVVLVGLLVGGAVLVPLGVLALALAVARRWSVRRRRERVLDVS